MLLPSCETYKYMRDPLAPERAEALERSVLLVESEANMPLEGLTLEGLPISGPAAFYNDFPDGTNPDVVYDTPLPEFTDGGSSDEFERWVHGPDGILVPASTLKKDDTPEATTDKEAEPQDPNPALPE